jgi:hypothetical protein
MLRGGPAVSENPLRLPKKPLENRLPQASNQAMETGTTPRRPRKRKFLILTGTVVLFVGAIVLFWGDTPKHFVGPFTPKDVGEIQRVVRQDVWRRAYPRFSVTTIPAMPRALWFLATSRVEQIDVLPGSEKAGVRLHSPLGNYAYGITKSKIGPQTAWRITSVIPPGPWLKSVESLRQPPGTVFAYESLRIEGGWGLIGGRLPRSFVAPTNSTFQTPRSVFETSPLAAPSGQDHVHSADEFSESLSGAATLQLRPERQSRQKVPP